MVGAPLEVFSLLVGNAGDVGRPDATHTLVDEGNIYVCIAERGRDGMEHVANDRVPLLADDDTLLDLGQARPFTVEIEAVDEDGCMAGQRDEQILVGARKGVAAGAFQVEDADRLWLLADFGADADFRIGDSQGHGHLGNCVGPVLDVDRIPGRRMHVAGALRLAEGQGTARDALADGDRLFRWRIAVLGYNLEFAGCHVELAHPAALGANQLYGAVKHDGHQALGSAFDREIVHRLIELLEARIAGCLLI